MLPCSGSLHRWSGGRGTRARGKGTQRRPGRTLSHLHDYIDGRIEPSLDVGGSALLGEPVKPAHGLARDAATASRSSDPARRGRQLRRLEGSRGSDPRLLGLTMGGYLIAHSGSDPVDQRSTAPRVRPMHNLRHSHQSRQKLEPVRRQGRALAMTCDLIHGFLPSINERSGPIQKTRRHTQ
jgi:hypothetical protein